MNKYRYALLALAVPLRAGASPDGPLEIGGMFTTLKVRRHQKAGDHSDPGWYTQPAGTQACKWLGEAPATPCAAAPDGGLAAVEFKAVKPNSHLQHH